MLGAAALAQLEAMQSLGPPPAGGDALEHGEYIARAKAITAHVQFFDTAVRHGVAAVKAAGRRKGPTVKDKWVEAK